MKQSDKMKRDLLFYWRYRRKCAVSYEVKSLMCKYTQFYADVMVIDQKNIVTEIEIKTSMQDLKNELKNKFTKHLYLNGDQTDKPNKFYFCIPQTLIKKAQPYIEENFKNYGIISWWDYNIEIIKQAKILHHEINEEYQHRILKSLSSQVYNLQNKIIKLEGRKGRYDNKQKEEEL